LEPPLARLVDVLPLVLQGQVLVTSRDASWDRHASLTELEVFAPTEAVAFLLARSGSSDQASAAQVAELLGFLPLALEQAAAYVRETRMPLAVYLERLRQYPALTLARGQPRDRAPTDTVATTWQVSLERIGRLPGPLRLLELCALLGPEEIPRDLFTQQLDPAPPELAILRSDPFAFDDAVAVLRRFGLVKASNQALTVHRLLQQVIRDRLDPAAANSRAAAAVRLLAEAFPDEGYDDPDVWPRCAQLLPHAVAAAEHAQHHHVEPAATSELLDAVESYLDGRGRYAEARPLAERALALAEAAFGPEHEVTALRLNNLAVLVHEQGDLDGARRLHERALAIREARLGADHPDTATSLDNLAGVLGDQGDLDGARRLHERALAIYEARLGTDHPATRQSRQNLADTLKGPP
jgi:tetratricopeptide (TPR) repeat protein